MSKIIFFDTETTGIDAKIHAMHQLAGEIVIDNKLVDKFNYKINPFKGYAVDMEALAVSNTSPLDLLKYNKEFQVECMLNAKLSKYLDFTNKRDKFFLAGWRAPEFDVKFLEAFFIRNNKNAFYSFFWSNPIDVKSMATQYLIEKRPEIESFSLAPIAKYLGVEVNTFKLHTAAYDAYLCRRVYEILPKCIL